MPFSLFSQINLKGINEMIKDKKQFIKKFKEAVKVELRWKNFPFLTHLGHSPKKDFELFIFNEEKTEFSKRFFKAIKHPHFKRNCKNYENSKHLIHCYAMAAEKVIGWQGEFNEARYIVDWISERIIWDIPSRYIESNKISEFANEINHSDRFSDKAISDDPLDIIIEKMTYIKEKDYPAIFQMIKEKLKNQIKDENLLWDMKMAGKSD